MTFVHAWWLLPAVVPLLWAVPVVARNGAQRTSSMLKALGLIAIFVALAEPSIVLPQRKVAELVLVDTSASISPSDLTHASDVVRTMTAESRGNWLKIIPFGRSPRPLTAGEQTGSLHFEQIADLSAGTNLEAALTGTLAAIPSGYLPRLLLISDGRENEGSAVQAIAQLRSLNVPVDTIPLGGRSGSELHLESVSLPREAYSSEQFPINLSILSPYETSASIDLSAEGRILGHQTFSLKRGENSVRVTARVKSMGVVGIAGHIDTPKAGHARFEQAMVLRQARVLYLSQDPAGSDVNLLEAFAQANVSVTRDGGQLNRDLSAFQLVVLNNLDLNTLPAEHKAALAEYVKNGGGLLLIGGDRQVYKEDKQMDALDRALPARLAPPDQPKGTCVALIIDKSSSMEGRKIELARLSAIGVVDHLKPVDTIGVLIFDNSFQWAVPMRRAEDKSLIKRLISGITPDGGTQIAPALSEAYRRVLPTNANFKHIVLLTDGISEEGDSMDLAKEAAEHQVTISTVGLGQDVNRSYLEKVAATSGGQSYFLNEPMGLEQILLKDVETYSGSTAVEKMLTPIIATRADVLEGIGMENAPPLRGYARYIAKPGAEAVLQIDASKKDPLFVRWQYGLGRAAVFTSDAKSRWAEAWVAWPGYDKFWTNVTRDLLAHTPASEATASYNSTSGDLLIRYRLAGDAREPESIPPIYVLGPHNLRKPIEVKKSATRIFEGRVHIGTATGLFRVRPAADSTDFPEAGLYRPEPELEEYGANEALLKEIAAFTGGTFEPPPEDLFNPGGRRTYMEWQLWPAVLALAITLTLAELIARKWSGITARFRPQ